jgi:predicted RNase H-like HicB family nuclease
LLGVAEILNLQPKGSQAKPDQVRHFRHVIVTPNSERLAMGKTDARYEIILYWSAEDEAYIAEVPELPGCAADGATYHAALENVQVVIAEWIETARDLGRDVPVPRGRLLFA